MSEKFILRTILSLSILVVICNEILFNEIPELFNKGDEIGNVLSNFGLAYISSFIFYYVVVYMKEEKDKKIIYKHIYDINEDIILVGRCLVRDLIEASNANRNEHNFETMTLESYLEIASKIKINYVPKNQFYGSYANKVEAYLTVFIKNSTKPQVLKCTERAFQHQKYLSAEYINLLNNILSCQFIAYFANALPSWSETKTVQEVTFANFPDIYRFISHIQELHKYNQKVFLKYNK